MQSVEELYNKWLDEEIDALVGRVMSGLPHEEYVQSIGIVNGLSRAKRKFEELKDKYRRDDV